MILPLCPLRPRSIRYLPARRSCRNTQPRTSTPLDEEPIARLLFQQLLLVAPGVEDGTTLTMRFFNSTTQPAAAGPTQEPFVNPTHLPPAHVA